MLLCTHTQFKEYLLLVKLAVRLQPGWVVKRGHNSLHLRVILQGILALLTPNATLLVTAEGNRGIENVKAVHPDGSRSQRPAQGVHCVEVVAENTCS